MGWERLSARIKGWWDSTGSAQRIQLLAIVALLTLAFVALFTSQNQLEPTERITDLFHGRQLSDEEIEYVEVALGGAALTDYRIDGRRIQVPSQKRAEYMAVISDAKALPRSFHSLKEDAIKSASLIETSGHRSQRLHHALEQEARLAICALPGVVDAFVHIDSKVDNSFRSETRQTAVVGVKSSPVQPLDEQAFRTIQAMLLGFRAGLKPEDVTIADLTSGHFFRGSLDLQTSQSLLDIRKADLARKWKNRILAAIPFAPDAQVNVRILADEEGTQAVSVTCSVSIPRLELVGQSEAQMRKKLQSAIMPIIPKSTSTPDEAVAVTFLDGPQLAQASLPISPGLILALLCGAAAGLLTVLMLTGSREPQDEEVGLRIFDGDKEGASTIDLGEAELRELAKQDPRAIAESLSAFIDRAS